MGSGSFTLIRTAACFIGQTKNFALQNSADPFGINKENVSIKPAVNLNSLYFILLNIE